MKFIQILVLLAYMQLFFNDVDNALIDSVHNLSEDVFNHAKLKDYMSFNYSSKNGKKVFVFDALFPFSLLISARTLFNLNDDWRYVLFDKYATNSSINLDNANGIPWKSWQNPTVLSDTRFGRILQALVQFSSQTDNNASSSINNRQYHLTEIYSAILRRADVTQLNRSGNNTSQSSYTAAVYLNPIWRKNSYGELLFYEDDDDFDIFAVISPHFGRVIIWDSSIRYIVRPPSINEISGQSLILAKFDSNSNTIYRQRTFFDRFLYELKDTRKRHFVCTNNFENVPEVDLEKLLVMERQSKTGYKLAVFDGLFNKTDLDALRSFTIKYGKYFYDDHLDLTSDNVQWIAGFNVKKFVNSRFWPIVRQTAAYISGKNSWYPYDVACNLIRSADHTKFHLDVSHDKEDELTFLLYLNPNWTAAYYGETAFMEMNYDSPENDYVAEVVPKYGRAIIFDGHFPHSAHPPAPDYPGPRYTLAVKLSINKLEAVKKALLEESRHNPIYIKELLKIIRKDPVNFERYQKFRFVASYFQNKKIQEILKKNPKTEDNMMEFINDDVNDELREFFTTEEGIPLSEEHRDNLLHMMDYLKFNVSALMSTDEPDRSDTKMLYTVEKRIAKWTTVCNDDADCLEDYLQLFLEQQLELKRRVTRDLLTIV